jgi:ATP-dependent exoDNAse (exonuclease V) beta subunit
MANIELTFAWSSSRIKTLRECARRYWYNYFCAWEGWLKNAPQEKKDAYLLKNMTNFPMWIGSIVHETIEYTIQTFRSTGKWISLESSRQKVINLLRQGWLESKNKEWKINGKKINFFEMYYNQMPDKNKLASYKTKALKCIEAFYKCDLFKTLNSLEKHQWISVEQFQKFQMATGEEVSVKLDLAFKDKGKLYIVDFKTGKPNDNIIEQVVTYSLYALKMKWVNRLEDIIIIPAFLSYFEDDPIASFPAININKLQMQQQIDIIKREYPLLAKAHENREDRELFEMTEDIKRCNYCNFKSVCPGGKR